MSDGIVIYPSQVHVVRIRRHEIRGLAPHTFMTSYSFATNSDEKNKVTTACSVQNKEKLLNFMNWFLHPNLESSKDFYWLSKEAFFSSQILQCAVWGLLCFRLMTCFIANCLPQWHHNRTPGFIYSNFLCSKLIFYQDVSSGPINAISMQCCTAQNQKLLFFNWNSISFPKIHFPRGLWTISISGLHRLLFKIPRCKHHSFRARHSSSLSFF